MKKYAAFLFLLLISGASCQSTADLSSSTSGSLSTTNYITASGSESVLATAPTLSSGVSSGDSYSTYSTNPTYSTYSSYSTYSTYSDSYSSGSSYGMSTSSYSTMSSYSGSGTYSTDMTYMGSSSYPSYSPQGSYSYEQPTSGKRDALYGYYRVVRDTRNCPSPMCGGYYVKKLNKNRNKCGDNRLSKAEGCYVADFHGATSHAGYSMENSIVEGTFMKYQMMDSVSYGNMHYAFHVEKIYYSAMQNVQYQSGTAYFMISMEGDAMVAYKINRRGMKPMKLQSIDYTSLQETSEQRDYRTRSLQESGLIVLGSLSGSSSKRTLVATNYYFMMY